MIRISTVAFIYIAIHLSTACFAQSACEETSVTLTSQEEVSDFPRRNCSSVCSLRISGNDITNLDSLYVLQHVGALEITFNPVLQNLDGLSGITELTGPCGGALSISYNNVLSDIDGLSSLTRIEGSLSIYSNTSLAHLGALSNLSAVGGESDFESIYIAFNASLTDIDGLSGLTSVPGAVVIEGHPGLQNVDGLASLTTIGTRPMTGGLTLSANDALAEIDGLASLDSIRGMLLIQDNPMLTSIDGLSGLRFVGVWSVSGESVKLINNDQLERIDALSGLTAIPGWLIVEGNESLADLDGLESVTTLGGTARNGGVTLRDNASLQRMDGLRSVTAISGGRGAWLEIVDNPRLDEIEMPALTSVQGSITAVVNISNNARIPDLDGLGWLETVEAGVAAGITISNNARLDDIDGLSSLLTFRASSIGITITDNPTLGRFCGLFPLFTEGTMGSAPPGSPYGTVTISGNERNPTREEIASEGPCDDGIQQPVGLTFSQVSSEGMRVTFRRSPGFVNGYLVLMKAYGAPAPEDEPIDGMTYRVGQVIGSSTIVVHSGSDTTLVVSGLSPSTPYYFDVFAWRNTEDGIDYQTVNPLSGSRTTADGSVVSSTLTFSDITDNSLTVNLAATEGTFLTLMKAYGYPSPNDRPQDGVSYQVGDVVGSSSVVVNKGSGFPFTAQYLLPSTRYYFDVYRFDPSTLVYEPAPWQGHESTSDGMSAPLAADERLAPYPNPFDEQTVIPFRVDNPAATVQVTIYDLVGREVEVLATGSYTTGLHEASWNGADRQGRRVQPGVYVYSIRSESGIVTGRISVR